MKITVVRDEFGENHTLSTLAVNGKILCDVLEDTDRKLETGGVKEYGETAIPRGTYKVIIDYSNRFKRELPHILDVPQFEGVRIHPGNTPADTHGCLLPGRRGRGGIVNQSRNAFNELFGMMEAAYERGEDITLEIM